MPCVKASSFRTGYASFRSRSWAKMSGSPWAWLSKVMPRADDLVGQHFDLLADAVADRLQDVGEERRPGVAGQQRRDVGAVELRPGLGARRLLDAGDRQHLEAGVVLRREQQLEVEDAHLHRLRIDAGVLVFEFLRLEQVAHAVAVGPGRRHWPCPGAAPARRGRR